MALGAENLIYFPFSATLYQRQGKRKHCWTLEAGDNDMNGFGLKNSGVLIWVLASS